MKAHLSHQDRLSKARIRKAVVASSTLTSNVQAAFRSVQDMAERNVLIALTGRIEQILEAARSTDWAPAAPFPVGTSGWVDGVLSQLQVGGLTGHALLCCWSLLLHLLPCVQDMLPCCRCICRPTRAPVVQHFSD